MVGREVLLRVEKPEHQPGEPLLQVRDLHVSDDRGLPAVRGVSFEVRAGEIVGVAGVDANGQSEVIEAIIGLRHPTAGQVILDGEDLAGRSTREILDAGVGHIAEDRHRRGLVLQFDLAENIGLREYRKPGVSASAGCRRASWPSVRAGCCASTTSAGARPTRSPPRSRAATSRRP